MAQDLVIPENFGAISAVFQNITVEDDLGEGIVGGFSVLGYRGKVWRVKHKGDENNILDENGNPVPSVEVIIVKSSTHVSKLFYKDGYQDNSEGKRPDCFSSNGVSPDATVLAPVAPVCAACPNNAFGSRVTDNGKPGKACSDHKRLVIVPMDDPANELFGGPMLLRVPAASLAEVSAYGTKVKQLGWPYYAIATRVKFDINEAFPKLLFSPIRPLNDDEARLIIELREDPRVARILNEEVEALPPATPESNGGFEQPPAAAPAPARRPPPPPAQARPAAPAATPPAPQPRPVQQAPKPVQAHPAPPPAPQAPKAGFSGKPAPAAAPAPAPKAGGFGRPAGAPAPAPRPAPTTIAGAVAQPAARPPTTRMARPAAPAPVHIEAPGEGDYEGPGDGTYSEEQGEGLPAGLDAELDGLLNI
jgi:hypothetical protein